ncbi:uncharacterized protein LOC144160630 [Haemaphysalis longicornis]
MLRDVNIQDDDVMVSFDVKSMFTCVPVDFAVQCCKKVLQNNETLASRTPIEDADLCRLLGFCLRSTYFVFKEEFYKQVFGTAMGASISVTCANLALEAVEKTALSLLSRRPKIFVRYVDDCFCVLKREDAPVLLEHLNSVQPTIQFTMEEEAAGRIAFLDVEVQRKNTGFVTTVYRKPTHTGQYLDFASAHQVGHKRSVASALFTRAQRLCSSTMARRAEEKKIREDLASNGYPSHILNAQQRRSANPPTSPRKER